jgi:hypothetical protein
LGIKGIKLDDARTKLQELSNSGAIEVSPHALKDYPERGYSLEEVAQMVKRGGGLKDTKDYQFKGERFLMNCKDNQGRMARFVITFDFDESTYEYVMVVSAGERKC